MTIENELLESCIFHTKNLLADLEEIKRKHAEATGAQTPFSHIPPSGSAPASTQIATLKEGDKKVNVTAKVTATSEPRHANEHLVQDVTIADESGKIKLVLWDDDVGTAQVGASVKVENGYVSAYRGTLQLNIGYGKLTVEAPKQ